MMLQMKVQKTSKGNKQSQHTYVLTAHCRLLGELWETDIPPCGLFACAEFYKRKYCELQRGIRESAESAVQTLIDNQLAKCKGASRVYSSGEHNGPGVA